MQFLRSLFVRKPIASPKAGYSGYHVFTTDYDRIVRGEHLNRVLGKPSETTAAAQDEAWDAFLNALAGWKTRLALRSLEISEAVRKELSAVEREDTVVSILIDHSGSMRGQPILLAAASADIVRDFLTHLGCKVEILGFTTSTWKGGEARRRWIAMGKPPRPGRLCELVHIIYCDSDDTRKGSLGYGLQPMLRQDVLKENVDGEALEWAASRLFARPEKRRILVILSDGAPVDDSTLSVNGPDFLMDHLKSGAARLNDDPGLQLAGIGIGHSVSALYRRYRDIEVPEHLGENLLSLLQELLLESAQAPLTETTAGAPLLADRFEALFLDVKTASPNVVRRWGDTP